MSNTPQNSTQKTSGSDYSNQSKQGMNPGQKGQESSNPSGQDKNADRNSTQKDSNKSSDSSNRGGMKNDPQSRDPKREEEDRPRAGVK